MTSRSGSRSPRRSANWISARRCRSKWNRARRRGVRRDKRSNPARGALGKQGAIVVKVSKPNQDFRFDVPVIGCETLEVASAAGVRLIAVEAGKTLLLDKEAVISFSRRKAGYDIRLQNMSNRIRAGIVGVGSIGKNHARIYSDLPGVEFSAILDTNPETANAISQQHGVKAVTTSPSSPS